MSAPGKKIIAVVGATGLQGGSVARTFLSLPDWHVRCLARNPSSETAVKLASQGAEVVQADLDDVASLSRAFDNVNAIFLNTKFFDTYRPLAAAGDVLAGKKSYDRNLQQGKNAAAAAAAVPTLERLVYSTLASARIGSGGKYSESLPVEVKFAIYEHIQHEHPQLAEKTSLIILGAYFTNRNVMPKPNLQTGSYVMALASKVSGGALMPMVDPAEATGPYVRALVEDEVLGTRLLAYNSKSNLTIEEILALWCKRTGKEASFAYMSIDDLEQKHKLPKELTHMLAFMLEYGYTYGLDNVIEPKDLKKEIETTPFEEWIGKVDPSGLL